MLARYMKVLNAENSRVLTQKTNELEIQQSDIVELKWHQGQWYLFYYGAD